MANSFTRRIIPNTPEAEEKDVLKLAVDGGTPVKINKDGTIEAKGFIDRTDNLEFFTKGTNVFAKYKINKDTSSILNLNTNTLTFSSLKSHFLKLKDAFLSYKFPKIFYSHIQTGKTPFLGRNIKRIIASVLTSGSTFIYHFTKSNKRYADKFSTRLNTKIFKVPVQLRFADSFRDLNDLIIIKTGQFNYAGSVRSGFVEGAEKIVYVSPHEEFSGIAYYKTTGSFRHLGTGDLASTFSGASGNADSLARGSYYYLSSKDYIFSSGYVLSGGATYQKFNSEGNLIPQTGASSITGTSFFSLYTGLQNKVFSGKWNGVIPAYTPFYIETWSTNAFSMGYEGSIEVVPYTGYGNLEIEVVGFGSSSTNSQAGAEGTAERFAKAGALKKLESTLIKIGAVESGSSLRKYVKHIENQTES